MMDGWGNLRGIFMNLADHRKKLLKNLPLICAELPFNPSDNREVNRVMYKIREKGKTCVGDLFLCLPMNSGLLPVLTLYCDFKKSSNEITVELHLYGYFNDAIGGESKQKLKCFGFRFEGGHVDKKGKRHPHDYYHVQLLNKSGYSKGEILLFPEWISHKIPCIPLKIDNPVSLVLYILASLYGREMFRVLKEAETIESKYKNPIMEMIGIPPAA